MSSSAGSGATDSPSDRDGRKTRSDTYWGLASPPFAAHNKSMRVRMRKQPSNKKLSIPSPDKLVGKLLHFDKARSAFKTDLMLSFRIALGVLLAGVAQTRAPSDSDRQWYFLPHVYYIGGLSWAAVMTIFAASRHIGGAIMQIWQIDVGVAIALLFNFVVFSFIPMNQEDLIQVPLNFNGTQYYISLQDWGKVAPLILLFTLVMFVSPMDTNVKKFAVSTNLYFMLTVVSPMNPAYPTTRKDLGNGYFGTENLMKNFALYCAVGVVGTLISLATMVLPYPLFAIRELQDNIRQAPAEIREIMNLIVDAYCFRARDIRDMDFFRLKLGRLMDSSRARLKAMDELLKEAWWEELVGGGWFFCFNKTIVKQFVHLYARVIKDLNAMKFAIELETCPATHAMLMKKLQRNIYLVQIETNDLLDEISANVLSGVKIMPTTRFHHLEQKLSKVLKKFTYFYGELLTDNAIRTPGEVASSMPLNLFLYSFHTLVQTLSEFENAYNKKNYSTTYRVRSFLNKTWRSYLMKDAYPITAVVFSLRTTLSVGIGLCFSTFVFAFSSTVPNAIAMVADNYQGGTYGNTVNRLSGLVAGTVMPSIFNFFICKAPSNIVYNALNNIALCFWTMASMYVYYSGSYIKTAGMVSAYMAASVFLEHSCRSQTGFKALSYSSLTENSLGIMIIILVELVFRPRSARTLLRANISAFLTDYSECLNKVYRHHLAVERGCDGQLDDVLDPAEGKELRKHIDGAFAKHLEQQAKLLQDASLEPELWRPVFSVEKYQNVLDVCENLLAHLRILVDLVEWHERRRNEDCELNLCQNPETGSFSKEVKAYMEAQRAWYASQDDYAGTVGEALETLAMLFGEKFAQSDAEENALFMQMKEAFRLADVDRSGEVDAHELATLLDKLIPVAARGNVRMDQYVAEFLRLVDRNRDGKVSYAEFMDALNHGFRLELEICNDMGGTRTLFREPSQLSTSNEVYELTEASATAPLAEAVTDDSSSLRQASSKAPPSKSVMGRILAAPSSLLHVLPGIKSSSIKKKRLSTSSSSPQDDDDPGTPPSLFAGDGRLAMEAALLNVESFSVKDAAHALRTAYGKYLLLQTAERHVAVEDFIVMSCLICATDEIAARLTSLNTLTAT